MPRLTNLFTLGMLALSATGLQSGKAEAYPIDCAILLCLAGGWPASAECGHARAVFIRRITPWPIEPPLQIWNCPMRARLSATTQPMDRLFNIALRDLRPLPLVSSPDAPSGVLRVQDRADVDISDPAFDFVRSIRVFEITYRQSQSHDGDCNTSASVFVGSYGPQGDYRRKRSRLAEVPKESDLRPPSQCRSYRHRSVFVEWRDYKGSYGFEEVQY